MCAIFLCENCVCVRVCVCEVCVYFVYFCVRSVCVCVREVCVHLCEERCFKGSGFL